jgi:putative membrane protein
VLKNLLVAWVVIAVAIGLAAAVVPSVDVHGGFGTLLWLAVLYGFVNAHLGPLLRLLFLPLTVLTLGLFGLVVNGLLLAATAGLSDKLDVGGFLATMLAALLITVFASAMCLSLGLLGNRAGQVAR